MLDDKKHAMDTFYEIHAIPARHMIPATISIPLVIKACELIKNQERAEETIKEIYLDLVRIFGRFAKPDPVTIGRMVFEIARKLGYDTVEGEDDPRWVTREQAEHYRENEEFGTCSKGKS